jgi:hypothetical protein
MGVFMHSVNCICLLRIARRGRNSAVTQPLLPSEMNKSNPLLPQLHFPRLQADS